MQYLKSKDVKYWIGLLAFIAVIFFFFSDREFSIIFTLSGTVQTFGFALIVIKITRSRSVAGLSKETFICYTTLFSIRAILFLFYKVNSHLRRGIFPMIRLATSSSESKSSRPQPSLPTSYT